MSRDAALALNKVIFPFTFPYRYLHVKLFVNRIIFLFHKDGLSAIEVWGQSEQQHFTRLPQKRPRDDDEETLKALIDVMFADL